MTTDIEGRVAQLRRAGLRPSEAQLAAIREAGADAVPALLQLATDTTTLLKDEPASLAPIHALRLLGEQGSMDDTSIERLLHVLPLDDYDPKSQAPFVWRSDLPQILGGWGAAAAALAQPLAADTATPPEQRVLAFDTLGFTVEQDPALRPGVVAFLREQLASVDNPLVGAAIVRALSLLHAGEAYREVMDAYKRGVVNREIIEATNARQQLLSPRLKNALDCVHHTLDERYEQHGPYTEEQQQAFMDEYQQRLYGG
jgi:hypothetical protein